MKLLRKFNKAGHVHVKKATLWGKPSFIQRRRDSHTGFNITSSCIDYDSTGLSLDYVKTFADEFVKKGIEPTGDIELNPDWKRDYVEWTDKELDKLKPNLERR